MKRIVAFALCALLALSLVACGGGSGQTAPTPIPAATEAPAPAAETPAPAPTEAPAEPTPEPQPESDPAAEAKALALSLKDAPVQELYDALGEPPLGKEYTSSCLVQGGQDGQLMYEGFTVYTLVQPDGTETVYDVE